MEKNNKGLMAIIVILFLVIMGLIIYIIMDKDDKQEKVDNKEEISNEVNKVEDNNEVKDNELKKEENNQQVETTIEQKDAAYFNDYLDAFMTCDGENVSRNTTTFTDEDISNFVSNYVVLKENTNNSSGEYTYELSKSEVDSLVYKYFNTKSYNIKKIDGMAMSSITQQGNNYKFEWEGKGCGYTQYKNPVVTYNGVNVTVRYDLYDAMAEEYTGTSTFHLRYNNGNYNIVKIEK